MGRWVCQGYERSEYPQGLSLIDPAPHAISEPTAEGGKKKGQGIVTTVKSSFVQDSWIDL